ncbi:MAG: ELWxxDGT repeat protein, partial [Candidatus Thermoplasmatota archaeon]|nr:ELWxxDGT repeat protein [Candidatus Thermoplasmatota archaeon]
IVSNAPNNLAIKLTTIQGSGQGLTASPIYDISPQLPDGLTMNWRTGTISGTPTEAHANTTHTVTVTALGYTTTATFTLFITGAPGAIAYSDISGTKHTPITPITPTFTNTSTSGLIDTWEIYPNPPLGLNFGSTNGTIWGTPTVVQLTPITYTVWANNTGGSATATLDITIADNLASFSYPNSPHIIVRGYIMSDITPTVTSGTVVSWGIHPSLPSGLSFTNGVISGRPTVNQTTTIYTVYANNSGGSATAILELTINEPTPNIDYHPDNYTLTNNTAIRIDPILQADPPSGSGTLLTGTSIRMKYSCMHQIGDLIFFAGRDELPGAQTTTGDELWALNHTEAISATNPYLVKDINAGVGDSINNFCGATVHNETLFFVANDGLEGYELWKSDGTNSGTQLVRSLYPGNQNSNPYGFFTIGDTLYFSARSTSAVHSIWKTDGTSAGTVQVSSGCNDYNCVFGGATEYNGNIYGNGYTPTGGVELFVMDGNSLQMLVDLNPGSNFNIPKHTNPQQLTVFNGLLYFETNGYNGQAIYRTDGTVAGTTQFLTGTTTQPMQIFNDELYFIHQGAGASGYELWKTDGTNVTLVKDVNPQPYGQTSGFCNSQANPVYSTCFTEFQVIGDYMLFVADSGSTGRELWITDGTTAGTRLLKDINPGATGSNPQKFYSMGDVVYFRADNGITGSELWRTDGTAVGTVLVNDIRSGSDGSTPGNFIDVDGELYFSSISTNGITGLYQVNNAANGIIGAPTTWTIWPSTLPNGLTFSNGVISGTPTDLQLTPTMYTITATNANGSSSTTINLTIIDTPPGTITYSPHDMVLTKNELMTPNVPTVTGDITTWETYPVNLPPGLNFGANNGTIWGTPSIILVSPITYTIWANNSGGSSTTTVNITINDQIPTITYSPSDYIFTVNDTISPSISPSISGGAITTWAINATLPNGVFFGPNNGTIYGMAGQLWPQHTYLITAANSGGTSSDYLNITIIDELPTSISYPVVNLNLTNNTASPDLPMSPQIQGPGVIISWEISGDLPQGLFFNVNTGEISGIATELWPTTDYTVWANNSGGSVIIEFNITVVDQLPTDINYNPSDLQLVNNTVSSDLPLIPQLNGPGQIIGWEINTSLPNGLNFGSGNGTIWGTPTELWPTTAYQVWANNTGGSVVGYLNITVVDQVPVLSYSPDIIELTNNTASLDLPLHSQLTGPGEITSWEISAGLPDGIFFGASNGTIWGTPTELWPAVSYTVWANNTGGSASASLTISVIDQVPTSITYAPSNLNLINNTASNNLPLNPQITGQGEITSWEISSGIPQGLTFDGNTGEISGIATELWPTTHYTIWA